MDPLTLPAGKCLFVSGKDILPEKFTIPKGLEVVERDRLESISSTGEQVDAIVSFTKGHDLGLFSSFIKVLKPNGNLYVFELFSEERKSQLEKDLLISGFIGISSTVTKTFSSNSEKSDLENDYIYFKGVTPNYQVGSSAKLSLPNLQSNSNDVASVWKLDGNDDDDDGEVINADDLLNEDDIKRPDPSSLKVCGTTGKRKACKDCSCGLAEELEAEKTDKKKDTANAKSSCGNCYLGDAFRCASCPYLGMPAFKPGEKIQLNDNFLAADI